MPCAAFKPPSHSIGRCPATPVTARAQKLATVPTNCPQCGGSGSVSIAQGPLQFRQACPRCSGSGKLPGDPCTTCDGSGRVMRAETIRVNIPPGADPGETHSFAGKRRSGISQWTGGRSLYNAAYPASSDTHSLRSRFVHGLADHRRRSAARRQRRGADAQWSDHGKNSSWVHRAANSYASKAKEFAAHGQTPAGDLYLRLMVRVPNEDVAEEVIDKIDQAYGENVRQNIRL